MAYNKVFSSLIAVFLSAMLSSFDVSSVISGHAFGIGNPELWPANYLAWSSSMELLPSIKVSEQVDYRGDLSLSAANVGSPIVSDIRRYQEAETNFGKRYNPQMDDFERWQDETAHATVGEEVSVSNLPVSRLSNHPPTEELILTGTLLGEEPSELWSDTSTPVGSNQDLGALVLVDSLSSQKRPIPVVYIQYDKYGYYDARNTWKGVDEVDLLARAMLAEENEKLFDPHRVVDFIGSGWVMVNRTKADNGYFDYAKGSLYRALTPYQQFALGGFITNTGEVYPGNVVFVSNPLAWPAWFGGDPVAAYWKAVAIAEGILNGTIPDPTYGALYFADAYLDDVGNLIPFPDGRTRFWHMKSRAYTIDQLSSLDDPPWP